LSARIADALKGVRDTGAELQRLSQAAAASSESLTLRTEELAAENRALGAEIQGVLSAVAKMPRVAAAAAPEVANAYREVRTPQRGAEQEEGSVLTAMHGELIGMRQDLAQQLAAAVAEEVSKSERSHAQAHVELLEWLKRVSDRLPTSPREGSVPPSSAPPSPSLVRPAVDSSAVVKVKENWEKRVFPRLFNGKDGGVSDDPQRAANSGLRSAREVVVAQTMGFCCQSAVPSRPTSARRPVSAGPSRGHMLPNRPASARPAAGVRPGLQAGASFSASAFGGCVREDT